ncbi:DUF6894 family protein [Microvirga lotononidis]|uniref:DUF6894 domain-containing protein n=1 Tax=Microvirga lotononidis TaxID=864069 RepID=I4YKC2_9HYPH|nr:hypothetical protein [Microvirga lotononidis]EIM24414.1 hypothetical protein MicloDRAFT_00069330 [Microvirga lotononidis]WQO31335.1 hypothetical protein U0023_34175 [Microvirga lotononidis]
MDGSWQVAMDAKLAFIQGVYNPVRVSSDPPGNTSKSEEAPSIEKPQGQISRTSYGRSLRAACMPNYYFNVVLNGHASPDHHGRAFQDDHEARSQAHHITMLIADNVREYCSSFIAVSEEDGRVAFKVPICRPRTGKDDIWTS